MHFRVIIGMLGLLLNSHEANLHSAVGYRLPEEFERDSVAWRGIYAVLSDKDAGKSSSR